MVHMDSYVGSEVKMARGCHHQGGPNKAASFFIFLQAFLPCVQHQHLPCFATLVMLAVCFPLAFLNDLMYKDN